MIATSESACDLIAIATIIIIIKYHSQCIIITSIIKSVANGMIIIII